MRKRVFSQTPLSEPEHVLIGNVVGVFGLKGVIKVQPRTDFLQRFEPGRGVMIKKVPYKIEAVHFHKGQARLKLSHVETIEQAEKLVGGRVYGAAGDALELEADEYLVRDLVGCEVVDERDAPVGILEEVISAPANDVYRVGPYLIPAVKEFILSVDLKARKVRVKLLRGMGGLDPSRPMPKPLRPERTRRSG